MPQQLVIGAGIAAANRLRMLITIHVYSIIEQHLSVCFNAADIFIKISYKSYE